MGLEVYIELKFYYKFSSCIFAFASFEWKKRETSCVSNKSYNKRYVDADVRYYIEGASFDVCKIQENPHD